MIKAAADGDIEQVDGLPVSEHSGLFIIAMGKMGAFELNYSSDIDIIVLYDPDKVRYRGRKSLSELYVRITRDLSAMMQEFTSEGYVFRVDLRLRPDAGVTQAAVNVRAAETYYESQGQNWERAAMIKARIAAGDGRRARPSGLPSPIYLAQVSGLCIHRRHTVPQTSVSSC